MALVLVAREPHRRGRMRGGSGSELRLLHGQPRHRRQAVHVAGPFLLLGTALVLLSTLLGWQLGGELGIASVLITALSHGVTLAGAFALFFRSGLVFDSERGLLFYWWGLRRPSFHRYASLAALARVGVVAIRGARSTSYYLVLHFADEKTWKYSRTSRDETEAEVRRIEQYLWPHRERGDGGARSDAA
jgi:hypothetical protein